MDAGTAFSWLGLITMSVSVFGAWTKEHEAVAGTPTGAAAAVEGEDATLQAYADQQPGTARLQVTHHPNAVYSHAGGAQDECFLNAGLDDAFGDGMNKTVAIPPPLGLSFQQSPSGAMIITHVKPGSNAEATGQLHKGMKIVSVNKTPVESLGKKEVSN